MPPLPRRAAPVLALALLLLLLPLATAGCTYLGAATAIVLGTGALDDGGRGGGAGGPGGTLNANTTAEIVDLPRTAAGTQPVVIRLIDAEGDRVNLRLEFRDAGAGAADFRAATLATVRRLRDGETVAGGPTTETGLLDTGPDGTEYVLDWSYEQDLGPGARASVTLRLVVVGTVDAPGGVAFTSENRKIGNEPPLATNVRVVGGRDLVFVRFDLADSSGDICAVDAFFTIEGEARQVLTPVDPGSVVNLQTAAAPREISFLWDTADPTQVGRRRARSRSARARSSRRATP